MNLNNISTAALVRLCFLLGLLALAAQLFAQSPLDRWYEEESIMNRDNPNNAYYNGPATTTEYDAVDYFWDASGPGYQGSCVPCEQNNPPAWCFEPGGPCEHVTAPIDSGILFLILGGIGLAVYHFRKNNVALA